jgi:hypothetical protein
MHYSLALRKNDALGRRCHAVRGVACPGGDTALVRDLERFVSRAAAERV